MTETSAIVRARELPSGGMGMGIECRASREVGVGAVARVPGCGSRLDEGKGAGVVESATTVSDG